MNCYIMFIKTPDENTAKDFITFVKEYGVFDIAFQVEEKGYEISKKLIQQRKGF